MAHRQRLLEDAKKTFKYIYNDSKTYGLVCGDTKEFDTDIVFASSSTLSKQEYLNKYKPDEFDYIIIDEAHHSQANNHLAIINYFKPKFLLGMTATAYRNDSKDIYELFDHNIAYEITLQKALKENLLCPFRYYGIDDVYIKDSYVGDRDIVNEEYLLSDKRIKYIMEKANYYGCYNNKVQGLIFVSNTSVARKISQKFNEFGWRTDYLLGSDTQEERNRKIDKLERRELDYIISVDVLNEGVDLPFVNQILMLRPTESPIVFVQQLGRGLRQYRNNVDIKTYVTIVDFIANYSSSFMIPIALSSNKTFNKELLKKDMLSFDYLLSESSIEFDRITEERIFRSINNFKTRVAFNLNESYNRLRSMLGKIPSHCDFIKFNEIDLRLISTNSNLESYIDFLISKQYWDLTKNLLNEVMLKYIRFIFNEFCDGKNIECIEIINHIINNQTYFVDEHNLSRLSNNYYCNGTTSQKYLPILDLDNTISKDFNDCLKSNIFKSVVQDLISFAKLNHENQYSKHKFTLYQQYTRADYCRIMKKPSKYISLIFGYRMLDDCMPIFITYHKNENILEHWKYKDEFITKKIFNWETQKISDKENNHLDVMKQKEMNGMRIDVFVQKDKNQDEGNFFYLGKAHIKWESLKIVQDGKYKKGNVLIELEHEIPDNIYKYLTNNVK